MAEVAGERERERERERKRERERQRERQRKRQRQRQRKKKKKRKRELSDEQGVSSGRGNVSPVRSYGVASYVLYINIYIYIYIYTYIRASTAATCVTEERSRAQHGFGSC